MSCSCNCQNVISISSSTATADGYVLESSNTPTLVNGGKYIVVIPDNVLVSTTEITPVSISINSVSYPLIDRCIGNDVYSDQIRFINQSNCCNKVMRVVFGTSPAHFKVISQVLPRSSATPNE